MEAAAVHYPGRCLIIDAAAVADKNMFRTVLSHVDSQSSTGTFEASNDEIGNIRLQLKGSNCRPNGNLYIFLFCTSYDDLAKMLSTSNV